MQAQNRIRLLRFPYCYLESPSILLGSDKGSSYKLPNGDCWRCAGNPMCDPTSDPICDAHCYPVCHFNELRQPPFFWLRELCKSRLFSVRASHAMVAANKN